MKVIITFTFCSDNLWKSKFMALGKPGKFWKSLKNSGNFFLLFCGHPVKIYWLLDGIGTLWLIERRPSCAGTLVCAVTQYRCTSL